MQDIGVCWCRIVWEVPDYTPHSEGWWHLQDASAAFAESIADLAPAELLHMGMDTSGSRSLEAFLGSAASAKVKKRVVSYAKLGSSPGGSHVAQACYRTAVSLFRSLSSETSCLAALHNRLSGAPCSAAACQTISDSVSELFTALTAREVYFVS